MSELSRADKARAIVMFEELAAALRVELLGEAAAEHAQGSTPSWRMGDVTVSSSLSNPSVVVEDPKAFLAYVEAVYPTEVETIVPEPVTQIRPHFAKNLLTQLAKSGAAVDHEGTVIPGLKFVPGGVLRSIAVKPTSEFKADATRFALEVAAGQRPLALPSVADEALTIDVETPLATDADPDWSISEGPFEPASDADVFDMWAVGADAQ